jgi:hypothetical protein
MKRGLTSAAIAAALLASMPAAAGAQTTPRGTANACPTSTVPDADFWDTAGASHQANIDCIVWWGVTSGNTLVTYAPDAGVTRDQMASFIARTITAAGAELPATSTNHFTDDNGNTHEANINRLAEAGVVNGVGGGRFDPSRVVRRDQMATFLANAYEYIAAVELPADGDSFADTRGNAHEENVRKIVAAGFTAGTGPGAYSPAGTVTRGQMGSFLARLLDKAVADLGAPIPATTQPRLSGVGDDVIRGRIPDNTPAVAIMSHRGENNFIIWAVDGDGERYDLVVNEIGDYDGRGAVNFDRFGRTLAGFNIDADGPWTMRILPASQATRISDSFAGQGDDVLRAGTHAGRIVTITHRGDANFVVWAYDAEANMSDLLVNEIGDYDGRVALPNDTHWLEIRADGEWTFEFE